MRLPLVASVFLAGCAGAPATPVDAIKPGEEFTLTLRGDVRLADTPYVIIFEKVLEDSRCARGATCVWEGNARVQLILREYSGVDRRTLEVLDLNIELDTHPRQTRQRRFDDYVIELRELEPYPALGTQTESSSAYRATLFVDHPPPGAARGTQ
jgi:hypothetical protein